MMLRKSPSWPLTAVIGSEISVTEAITETEMIDPMLTETETMVILKTEIL